MNRPRTSFSPSLPVSISLSLSLACGGSHSSAVASDGGTDATSDATSSDGGSAEGATGEAGTTRPYQLATGGVQILVTGPTTGLQITPADVAMDADLIDLHQEYYGVPWNEFSQGLQPPGAWIAQMNAIEHYVAMTGKRVFLSVSMLDGARKTLAPQAVETDGSLASPQPYPTACFDFASDPSGPAMKQAYLAYVTWMIDEFHPAFLNVAVEVNLFFENCPSAAAGVVDVSNAAYATAKALVPSTPVFPSFQIEHLYGYSGPCPAGGMTQAQCFDTSYAQITGMKRDRFAMSTYPTIPGVLDTPSQIPADWFTRGAARGGERPVLAETGWNSSSIVAQTSGGTCMTVEPSTEADTAAYLGLVLAAARAAPMDLVDWWSDEDLVVSQLMTDCPCTFDPTWCTLVTAFAGTPVDGGFDSYYYGQIELKGFGAMGLRDYAGNPKPTTLPVWTEALQTPLAP
jgi:hypothetical protein